MGKGSGQGKGGGKPIKNVVVLMLENRSFDHMLGFLKEKIPNLNGLNGDETNPYDPSDPSKGEVQVSKNAPYVTSIDPSHSVSGTATQLFCNPNAEPVHANNQGFVYSYNVNAGDSSDDGAAIMECFAPDKVPSITALAQNFAVCDAYFASIPGPTQPNRMYVHSATSHGAASNDKLKLIEGYPQTTIYDHLYDNGYTWKDYFSDFPGALVLKNLRQKKYWHCIKQIHHFYEDASNGTLPNYSFLEPRYFKFLAWQASDQHPPHPVEYGEFLIADVYEALANSPQWNETLLIITYDEHGGFFDHVPPITGIPNPDGLVSTNPPFKFERQGVRIPVVLASPWIAKGSIINEPTVAEKPYENSQFEHSSVCATIKELFDLPSFLTKRDAWAATFMDRIESAPREKTPTSIPRPGTKEQQDLWRITESERETPARVQRQEKMGLQSNDPITELQQEFLEIANGLTGGTHDTTTIKTEHEGALFIRQQMAKFAVMMESE